MSNLQQTTASQCDIHKGCGAVQQIIHPKDKDLGGFSVRRALPNQQVRQVGPWIFFDHMGPATFAAGTGINVRPHPHINIATVTYLFHGEILHRDSIGSVQAIRPGDINLMVTGSGMVHSERERAEVHNSAHQLNGLQLWLALPEQDEETAPAFYHYPAATLPQRVLDGVPLRVMIGSAYGVTSPVKTFSSTLYVEAQLQQGQSLPLPEASERGLYVVNGEVSLKDTVIAEHDMAVLDATPNLRLTATRDSQIAIIGGDPLGHRYIDWNFVSSRQERIEQAKQQWREMTLPLIPGDDKEFIPYPTLTK
ncbi:pirin family protein [Shewanella dokdonensis]|uniref:Pirin family protein n=1 Tax=Shewanella dokdonensis TaxID=712036 RepID=A0ABX8DH80_9GAMM|nr:pirin family protein [Shewanella dokdonensis]MCL1074444.1 pirin family protein [Shewanella dokdonensis]QVK24113.1 pirin family protein [Shewanella dokdonensis]